MKVEFSSASVVSIPKNRSTTMAGSKKISPNVSNLSRINSGVQISFKGNTQKNYSQFLSIAPEDKGLGIPEYNQGGLAVVTQEAPESWNRNLKADSRTILPYHSYDNPDGGIKVLRVPYENGKPVSAVDPKMIRSVGTDYQLKEGERFVIQSAPSEGKSKFIILEKLGIQGSITRLNPDTLEKESVPYHLFKAEVPSDSTVTRYILHTPDLAKFPKAYNPGEGAYSTAYSSAKTYGGAYGGAYGQHMNSDAFYADNAKAAVDAMKKLNKEKHGNFNPASIWLHDRFSFPAIIEISDRSALGDKYFNGLRMHGTYHNPGRSYQGAYDQGLEFLRIVAGKQTIQELENHPDYELLKQIDARRLKGKATADELKKANEILAPAIDRFKDSKGTYNMTKIPLVGTIINPYNVTSGTVSGNYGREMMNHNTYSIADGLTDDFATIKTINITNGSNPAGLKLGVKEANFGLGGNGLTAKKEGFATFTPEYNSAGKLTNLDKILTAKENNKKWLINSIGATDPNNPLERAKLFFSKDLYDPEKGRPSTVLGYLSPYEEGDKLIMGWGRPDPQKGYPTTFEAFYKFLQDPTISEETKKHTKLIVGAGKDTWSDGARDWKNIKKYITKIQSMDKGKYKGNVMYVNGLFPNRLVGCADYTLFTSVFEPCGLTPLESYSGGAPVISIKTGGAPDFIESLQSGKSTVTTETGFLTTNPYLRNPESLGLKTEDLVSKSGDEAFKIVDDARRNAASDEVAQCIKQAISLDNESYKKMVQNTFEQNISWSGNTKYNGGLSADIRYMREVFNIDEKTMTPIAGMERNEKPLVRVIGDLTDTVKDKVKTAIRAIEHSKPAEIIKETTESAKATRWGKIITAGAVGVVALGTASMVYLNAKKAKDIERHLSKSKSTFSKVG